MPTIPEVLCVDFAVFTCIQGAVMSLLLAFKGLQAHNLDTKADACLRLILIPTAQSGIEGNRTVDTKPRMPDDVIERTKTWKLTEITDSSQCRSIRLPDTLPLNKVICTFIPLFIDCQLLYRLISVAAFRWLTSPVAASNSGGYIEPYVVETVVALQW
jgi:hypothetical protein